VVVELGGEMKTGRGDVVWHECSKGSRKGGCKELSSRSVGLVGGPREENGKVGMKIALNLRGDTRNG